MDNKTTSLLLCPKLTYLILQPGKDIERDNGLLVTYHIFSWPEMVQEWQGYYVIKL